MCVAVLSPTIAHMAEKNGDSCPRAAPMPLSPSRAPVTGVPVNGAAASSGRARRRAGQGPAVLLVVWLLVGAIGLQWAGSLLGGSSSAWAVLIFGPAILGALAIWVVVLVVLVVWLILAVATRRDATPPPAR